MSPASGHRDDDRRGIVRKAFDDWAAGTGRVSDLLADDGTWTIIGRSPVSGTYRSRQEYVDTVARQLYARLSTPVVPKVHDIYVDGDTVIVRFEASATAKDGKPYANTYAWFLTFRDSQVISVTAFLDTVALTDLWTRVSPAG